MHAAPKKNDKKILYIFCGIYNINGTTNWTTSLQLTFSELRQSITGGVLKQGVKSLQILLN